MKLWSRIFFGFLCATSPPTNALPVLNPGDSFSYEFSRLPYLGTGFTEIYTVPGWTPPITWVSLFFEAWPLSPGTQLQVKLFEDAPTQPPVAEAIWNAGAGPVYDPLTGSHTVVLSIGGGIDLGLYSQDHRDVWKDLQGAFSFTSLSGPVYVSAITVNIRATSSDLVDHRFTFDHYGDRLEFGPPIHVEFTIPEGGSSWMLLTAAISGLVWLSRRVERVRMICR